MINNSGKIIRGTSPFEIQKLTIMLRHQNLSNDLINIYTSTLRCMSSRLEHKLSCNHGRRWGRTWVLSWRREGGQRGGKTQPPSSLLSTQPPAPPVFAVKSLKLPSNSLLHNVIPESSCHPLASSRLPQLGLFEIMGLESLHSWGSPDKDTDCSLHMSWARGKNRGGRRNRCRLNFRKDFRAIFRSFLLRRCFFVFHLRLFWNIQTIVKMVNVFVMLQYRRRRRKTLLNHKNSGELRSGKKKVQ